MFVPVPFNPDIEWGAKPRHPVGGRIHNTRVRAVVEWHDGVAGFFLGPSWVRDSPLTAGDQVEVDIEPEGPQRQDLTEDVAAALNASPAAARFFDGLAQFYRRGYLTWIDGTKRSPELRKQRIAAMVKLLEAGVKDHRTQ